MNYTPIIEQTISFVKSELHDAEGGHDWFHIERVWRNAQLIAAQENDCDKLVVELGALLHDIADSKFHDGNEEAGPIKATTFLKGLGVDDSIIDHVVQIIRHVSYKGGHTTGSFNSIELQIVQDADRLDAMGAIGIARTFNYGGYKNNVLYNPEIPPNLTMSKEEYKKGNNPTLNHFYEKLLLLKDLMNTSTGKRLAQSRHNFMENFLEQFYAEWNGEQ
ncbi:phosphohydrolase [Nonlabens tegetincola]|uniref:HD domain-containing protein n=1 Tax=Nonlabens tegetincola TaxID=323273 RepID=UPI000A206564|nr:HD domain-containing protein [Nonlabens tegetincola]ARN70249.1 phosphohydrolase [Nonlabens tegetincola]